jgi:hypothetical protein
MEKEILMKKIYVFMDRDFVINLSPPKYIHPISHDSVIKEMEKGTDIICTHDPSFFQFDTLIEDGYDVIVLRGNNGVVLSELLDSKKSKKYIDKEMRLAHNVFKMLMAGAFSMVPMMFKIPTDYYERIGQS